MQRSVIIILCAICCNSLQAQEAKRDFQYFNSQIDSIVAVYSIENYKASEVEYAFFSEADLNVNEQKKIIEKIKQLFEQDKYVNLYSIGHKLLGYAMWFAYPEQNPIETNQLLLELYLQYYFYPGRTNGVIGWNYSDLDRRKNYTPKAKQRIIEILEGKKGETEYNAYLFIEKATLEKYTYPWENAAQIMKTQEVQNAEMLRQIRDSIIIASAAQYAKTIVESASIDPDLIRMIGFLDMKEAVPIMQQKLSDCIENNRCNDDSKKSYRYALARLGDEEQRQYILDNLMENFRKEDFYYFRDDEIVWKYIEVNFPSGRYISMYGDPFPVFLMTMNNVYPFIKNLPEELNFPYAYDEDIGYYLVDNMEEQYQWAQSLYEWLMANKDNVEFDYDGEKKYPWGW